jgi:hypothetical protein
MMEAAWGDIMPAAAASAFAILGLVVLMSFPAMAASTAVQEVACQPGPELRLAGDGTVVACRLAVAAELLLAPEGGNGTAACAAEAQVEFHRNGYLAFCNPSGAAASYVARGGRATRCHAGSRIAFDDRGVLEYCS